MKWNAKLWRQSQEQFQEFIDPLVAGLGRSERRQAGVRYVEGLLLPGQRKSIGPMAERLGVDGQQLQQFVTDSPWDEQRIWRLIAQEVIPSLEPLEAWVIDETGWLKQGKHSVGVSPQYCGQWARRPIVRSAWKWWSATVGSPRRWLDGFICPRVGLGIAPAGPRRGCPAE